MKDRLGKWPRCGREGSYECLKDVGERSLGCMKEVRDVNGVLSRLG